MNNIDFNQNDVDTLFNILKNRRDVRGNRFLDKKIPTDTLNTILKAATLAPSVGYSQPWKFVIIDDNNIKQKVYENFKNENTKAKKIFEQNDLYKKLKLEGIKEAPINIAVLYDKPNNPTLGMTSMDKMGEYSVVCAIQNMWLMARALNIGIGWVSILDENKLLKTINAPKNMKLIAYLCIGYVDKFYKEPELKILNWSKEKSLEDIISYNKFK